MTHITITYQKKRKKNLNKNYKIILKIKVII